tara:strand:- start:608 stop:1336 length:729 start_codon:yes stop_codon:yes gene_type:complete
MGFDLSLFTALLGFPFLYVLIFYLSSPKKSISIKDGLKAIVMGLLSTVLLHFNYAFFPPENLECMGTFQKYFYQIAVREETSKFLAFWLLITYSLKGPRHPLSYMFLSSMVGLGFAIEENLLYKFQFGIEILQVRNFTSTFAHMFFGAFLGYWYSMGKIMMQGSTVNNLKNFLIKWPGIFQTFYIAIGLLFGIIYHGLWNYNLATSMWAAQSTMILMIFIGFGVSIAMAKNLIRHYKEVGKV